MADGFKGLGGIVAAFVAIVIGISFFIIIADTTASLTNEFTVTNKSFTANNATAVVFAGTGENVTAISEVRNNVTTVLATPANYTSSITDRSVTMDANYSANSGFTTQTWYIDYTYQDNDYIDNGAARSVTNLIPLFFALAIMAASLIFIDFKRFGF